MQHPSKIYNALVLDKDLNTPLSVSSETLSKDHGLFKTLYQVRWILKRSSIPFWKWLYKASMFLQVSLWCRFILLTREHMFPVKRCLLNVKGSIKEINKFVYKNCHPQSDALRFKIFEKMPLIFLYWFTT